MASNRNTIKGLTVEIGGDTTKLGKALEDVNKKSGDLSAELTEINRQLKFDPKNTELLAQKQKVLAAAVETTGEKLEKLKDAERQVQKQFERGEVSEEQVRALKREIIATEGKLNSYKKAVKDTADAVDDLGEEAEDTSEKTGALSKGLKGAAVGIAAVAAAATAAAESTREYRTDMGKLETAFETAGHSSEAATETYKELQSILGDSGQAVEAANHLAQLAKNESDLAKWTEIATGVYATFGASLPIENLTEAANETAKTGTITGGFADAINWVKASADQWKVALGGNKEALEAFNTATAEGMSAEDAFNEALAACTTEQERQALITNTLSTLYGEASAKYKETNADVIAANEANEAWTESLAEVGSAVEPLLTTVKELGATLLRLLVPVIETITNNLPIIGVGLAGVTAAMIAFKISAIAATAATKGMTLAQYAAAAAQAVLNAVMSANPIGLIILGITALVVAVMAMVKNWEAFSEFFVKMWGGIKKAFTVTVDGIKKTWQSLLGAIKDPLAGTIQYCTSHFDSFRKSVESVFSKIKSAVNSLVDNLKALPGKIWSAISGAVTKVGEWGANMVAKAKSSIDKLVTTVVNKLKELPAKVVSIGGDLVEGLWKGVSDKFSWLKKKLGSFTTSVLDGIKGFFGVHSPSTETAWIGKMLDEGMALGVEKNAEAPIKAMNRLSSEMLTAASGDSDITLERRISHTFGTAEPVNLFADGLATKLDQIYKAILSGQVIMLDSKTLVGSTAARYDNELGQRRVLAERGAI